MCGASFVDVTWLSLLRISECFSGPSLRAALLLCGQGQQCILAEARCSLVPCSRAEQPIASLHAGSALFRRVFGWAKPSLPAADARQRDYTRWHLPDREALWLRHAESPTLAGNNQSIRS